MKAKEDHERLGTLSLEAAIDTFTFGHDKDLRSFPDPDLRELVRGIRRLLMTEARAVRIFAHTVPRTDKSNRRAQLKCIKAFSFRVRGLEQLEREAERRGIKLTRWGNREWIELSVQKLKTMRLI